MNPRESHLRCAVAVSDVEERVRQSRDERPCLWRDAKLLLKAMDDEAEIIRSEIPDVWHIVEEECWLEGERRGHPLPRPDPVIRKRVAELILGGAGAYLRRKHNGRRQLLGGGVRAQWKAPLHPGTLPPQRGFHS